MMETVVRTKAWEQLIRFHRMATKAMDQNLRATFGYSLDDYDVLHQIASNEGPIRMGDLAERLLVANSSCNRIVGRLVADELVSREQSPADKRQVLVDLTTSGRRLRRRMGTVHSRDIQRLFDDPLTDAQHASIENVLRTLLDQERND